ncbi:MAG TPA: hypothetical protein VMU45_13860 [Candidatus Eisenbacteria bacterium]|nr:hypothetical protein [Candidatus Eisenbacteria bacterium]
MILLVSASSRAEECATAIEQKTHQTTQISRSLNHAIELLQMRDYDLLVLDESFQQLEAGAESLVASHAGMALPVYVNLSLHGAERVALEVKRGLQRLIAERLASMRAAENLLRNDLSGEVTAILLNSELALRECSLSPGIAQKLQVMHELADKMRCRLEGEPAGPSRSGARNAQTKGGVSARTHQTCPTRQ